MDKNSELKYYNKHLKTNIPFPVELHDEAIYGIRINITETGKCQCQVLLRREQLEYVDPKTASIVMVYSTITLDIDDPRDIHCSIVHFDDPVLWCSLDEYDNGEKWFELTGTESNISVRYSSYTIDTFENGVKRANE